MVEVQIDLVFYFAPCSSNGIVRPPPSVVFHQDQLIGDRILPFNILSVVVEGLVRFGFSDLDCCSFFDELRMMFLQLTLNENVLSFCLYKVRSLAPQVVERVLDAQCSSLVLSDLVEQANS